MYTVVDQTLDRCGVLVEKMLDNKRYQKWNNNAGYVEGQTPPPLFAPEPVGSNPCGLGGIMEDSEEEDWEADERDGELERLEVRISDVPQAFSHFTYRHTGRKNLVCDLQGVFNKFASPPLFELTDPVIHYSSSRGRKMVNGRSDRGKKGMQQFFNSHKCNPLCNLLKLGRKFQRDTKISVPAPLNPKA